ncbi:MAG TPA: HypC/HybG/HupF family hydrogenase formation chaperone [Albitalea sp.]|nr:HypC/HybG/HupF family hydrogenase formation chaperone [Albitalea sp.]
MCLAVPSRIVRLDGESATVEAGGLQREVSLMLLDEAVAPGDYVLVQNGRFAYERLDADHARRTLALIDELVAGSDGADVRAW